VFLGICCCNSRCYLSRLLVTKAFEVMSSIAEFHGFSGPVGDLLFTFSDASPQPTDEVFFLVFGCLCLVHGRPIGVDYGH